MLRQVGLRPFLALGISVQYQEEGQKIEEKGHSSVANSVFNLISGSSSLESDYFNGRDF